MVAVFMLRFTHRFYWMLETFGELKCGSYGLKRKTLFSERQLVEIAI